MRGPVRSRGGWSAARRAAGGVLVAVLVVVTGAVPGEAQAPSGDAEAAYLEALADYEALGEERDRSFNRYERALDVVDRTRERGDASEREEAFAAFQTAAIDQMAVELETQAALDRLNRTRAVYLRELAEREDAVLEALEAPDLSAGRQAALEAEWQQIRRTMLELEAEVETEETIALRPVPELRVEPTDGPTELREKADFMREHALSYDSIIGDLDREIEELEERDRRLRGLEDLQRDLRRFGQGALVGAGRGSPTTSTPEPSGDGDTEATGEGIADVLAALPLPEQIELLRDTRALAVQYREEALAMADVFSARAEELGP